jgi:hypothetical protein
MKHRSVRSAFSLLFACLVIACLAIAACARKQGGAAGNGDSTAMERGIARYNAYRLEEAKTLFEAVVADEPENTTALTYLAATEKYLVQKAAGGGPSTKRPDYTPVRNLCLRALAIDPCQTFALALLADLYYPQFGMLENPSYDSTAMYLERGLRCPDPEPELFLTRLNDSWRLDRADLEREASKGLMGSRFFTASVLHYYRMLLGVLPPKVVVFTSGDMDTYPIVALQQAEGLRPDVTVANIPMLNMPSYASRVRRLSGLPAVLTDQEMENYYAPDGRLRSPAVHLIEKWLDAPAVKAGAPPLVVLGTVSPEDKAVFAQSRWNTVDYTVFTLYTPPGRRVAPDAAVYTAFLAELQGDRYREPVISARDKSAIRQVGDHYMLQFMLAYACLERAHAEYSSGRRSEAKAILAQVTSFCAAIPWPQETKARVEEMVGKVEKELAK